MASVKLLEELHVSPPPCATTPTTVPLTFFDVFWLTMVPVQRLFFYDLPDLSTGHFTSSILPNLKTSLSATLQHFFPLSGRLIFSPPQNPYIRCAGGDSVSVAVCQSDMDFDHLAGDGARSLEQVQALVPKLPSPAKETDGRRGQPLMALQITVFPNSGISIGVTYSHVAADGRALVHFIKSWASICRSGGDSKCISESLPVHSRDLISDPGNKIASINVEGNSSWDRASLATASIPMEKFRYTFEVAPLKVKELKSWVTRKSMQDHQDPGAPPLRTSTFIVTCALVWACLVRAQQETQPKQANTNDDGDGTAVCNFVFLADLRERLNLPDNHFGNCLRPCYAAAKRGELVGEDGLYEAAKAIGRAIEEVEKEGVKGAEGWLNRSKKIFASGQVMTIAGSPRFGVYEIDFGWGRPKKTDHAHIGSFGSVAIAESRNEVGGVEFGLALSAHEFDSFNHAFHWLSLSSPTK